MYRKVVQSIRILFVLCLFTIPAKNSWAMSADEATDAAFAALLQVPGEEPTLGGWMIPEHYFKPESQQELIIFLGKMKNQGADFNAYRHLGTLLHHAIRANFMKTTKWLLDHGADPQLTLKSGNENALDLSIRYGRVQLAQMLVTQYHVKANVKLAPPVAAPVRPALPIEADLDAMSAQSLSDADLVKAYNVLRFFGEQNTDVDRTKKWELFEAKLPAGTLTRIISDAPSFSAYIVVRSHLNSLDSALERLPAELVARHINVAIVQWAQKASVNYEDSHRNPARTYSISAETWHTLWKHRNGPIDYTQIDALAEKIQPDLWSELFATGYTDRNAESALGCLLTGISAADLKIIWKDIEHNFPNIRQVAPRLVLNGQRMPGYHYCWDWHTQETAEKLRYLTTLGINEEVKGIDASDWQSAPSDLSEAIKPFSQRAAADDVSSLPLVGREINCKLNMTLDWLGEINNPAKDKAWHYSDKLLFVEDASQSISSVQVVDIPGRQSCALLVGGSFTRNVSIDPGGHDSFDGLLEREPYPSCPDPWGGYRLLIEDNGKIEHIYTGLERNWNSGALVPVQDVSANRALFLRDEGGGGRCDGRRKLPGLYAIATGQRGLTIERVRDRDLEEALFAQCKLDINSDNGHIVCKGINQILVNPVFDESQGIAYADFLRRYYPDKATAIAAVPNDRAAEYEAALMGRDDKVLASIKQAGIIPPYWVTSTLHKIVESTASDEEKRSSILWVLSDTERLAAVSSEIYFLSRLLPYLERQDWQPILRHIEQPAPALNTLREAAAALELPKLACDINHAQGLVCGEELFW